MFYFSFFIVFIFPPFKLRVNISHVLRGVSILIAWFNVPSNDVQICHERANRDQRTRFEFLRFRWTRWSTERAADVSFSSFHDSLVKVTVPVLCWVFGYEKGRKYRRGESCHTKISSLLRENVFPFNLRSLTFVLSIFLLL